MVRVVSMYRARLPHCNSRPHHSFLPSKGIAVELMLLSLKLTIQYFRLLPPLLPHPRVLAQRILCRRPAPSLTRQHPDSLILQEALPAHRLLLAHRRTLPLQHDRLRKWWGPVVNQAILERSTRVVTTWTR